MPAFFSAAPSPQNPNSRRSALCIFATAILWWLSLQRFGFFAFGWIAFVPLLCALSTLPSARARFWLGWRAGVVCFALINWWILPAIIKGGSIINVSPLVGALLGVLAVFLIGVIHGAGIAIIALLWNPRAKTFARFPLLLPLFLAAFWYVFEVARATGVLAHSWGAFAFSQWRDVALLQSASVIGQHGLSALCVWFAASIALWLHRECSTRAPILWRVPLAVFLMLHLWGAWRIWVFDRVPISNVPQLGVLLVQTDISSLRKNHDGGESHFDQAERLTREYSARGGNADLIVWPETTAELLRLVKDKIDGPEPFGDRMKSGHATRSAKLAARSESALLLGAQCITRGALGSDEYPYLSNRAVLFSPDGTQQSSAKERVVPFGERAPLSEYSHFQWLKKLAPEPPVVPGKPRILKLPFAGDSLPLGSLICFESCFPDPARSLKNEGAKVLFVLTNDEWCSGTTAPWEHAAMSTLRAVENNVPVAQSANGGYSFAVDARGRFLKMSKLGRAQVLVVTLPIR